MAVTQRIRNLIKAEAGFKCAVPFCNNTSPLQIHHIIHQGGGENGTDTVDNLICLCSNCHGRYHAGEIDRQAIQQYKRRLVQEAYKELAPNEVGYLEALLEGDNIELDAEGVRLARRLERKGYVTINETSEELFQLEITDAGRSVVE
ncbi:HNH endonuclease [Marivirga sericea]|uniref:HNH endonuclease n=1 Tax=Marivirga sericea TaxID=1028 RepID=A0A1X7JS04_9BACT|nr:HNH endonuclease signature motif containing protein [Marivirga sericea]SMG30832.1 HNH endonuclease [Marivirga sericea]